MNVSLFSAGLTPELFEFVFDGGDNNHFEKKIRMVIVMEEFEEVRIERERIMSNVDNMWIKLLNSRWFIVHLSLNYREAYEEYGLKREEGYVMSMGHRQMYNDMMDDQPIPPQTDVNF